MKKYFISALALAGLTALASGLVTMPSRPDTKAQESAPATMPATSAQAPLAISASATDLSEVPAMMPLDRVDAPMMAKLLAKTPYAVNGTSMKVMNQPLSLSDSIMSVMAAPSRAAVLNSAVDLVGSYVQTSVSLVGSAGDSGNATKITLGEDENSIVIERFWSNQYTPDYLVVKATVDVATSTISIPSQYVYTDDTFGPVSLVKTITGAPLRDEPITATIAADGSISLTSPWALYIDEGTYKDQYIFANYNTRLRPANAKIEFKTYAQPDLIYSYDVLVEQTGVNTLEITNIANAGLVTEATLGGDRTMSVPYVPLEYYPFRGYLLELRPVCDFQYNETTGSITYYSFGLNSKPAAADNNTSISWGNWALLAEGIGTLDINSEGHLILNEGEISYPTDFDANFEGKGTAAEPYLIKTVDNLNALASIVNKTTCPPGESTVMVYADTYFRLEADLDLQNVPFTPVGAEQYHTFAGIFDGNGHKIKNLKQSFKSHLNYGGVFGVIGGNAVIKNLTVENAELTTNAYTGAIVGTGHGTIDNCHVAEADILNTNTGTGAIAGLFEGEVKNCSVNNVVLYGLGGFVGGAVGELTAYVENNALALSHISNCRVANTNIAVWGTSEQGNLAGGVVGNLYWANLSDSYFSGTIDGTYKVNGAAATNVVGGVCGAVQNSSISGCFAVGNFVVEDYKSYVGGVAGMLAGNMTNCYAAGAVQGNNTQFAGGLAGAAYHATTDILSGATAKATISSCYSTAQVIAYITGLDNKTQLREVVGSFVASEGISSLEDMVTITDTYFNSDLTDFGAASCRTNTSTLTSGSLPAGFASADWTATKGMFPRLKGLESNQAALMAASSIEFAEGSTANRVRANATLNPQGDTQFYLLADGELATKGGYCNLNGNTLEIGTENGIDYLMVSNGSVIYPVRLQITGNGLEGLGTEESPMLIRDREDLKLLASLVTVNNSFHGIHFLMTNDIDLDGETEFQGIAVAQPVNASLVFSGIFDGGGHTIHNMKLHGVTWQDGKSPADDPNGLGTVNSTASVQYQAFIGRLDVDGVLKNINFAADCSDERYSYGAIAVAQCKGTIENVRNYASVSVYNGNAGSMAAAAEAGAKIINCFNAGDVTSGGATAGGIVGTNKGDIEKCANTGAVASAIITNKTVNPGATTMGNVGGIVGSMSDGTLLNVLNAGPVYAYTHNAGGICGNWLSKKPTVGAVSYGTVGTAKEKITTMGGFAGDFGTNASIPEGSGANYFDTQIVGSGSVGIKAAEGLIAAETATMTSGQALADLDAEVWDFKAGMYPVLAAFADEPSLEAYRRMVVAMPAGNTRANLHGASALAEVQNLAWSLANGSEFTISGSQLLAPTDVEAEVTDTLTATYGAYTKSIALSSKPGCPVEGEGTAENPLVIPSAQKWNELADWMQMMLFNTEGVYVVLSDDIDFEGGEIKALSPSDANPWAGTFDGRDHTVKGFENVTTASYPAMFNTVTAAGVIKNVTFEGKFTSQTGGYISVVAGKLYGKIENVTTDVEMTSTAALNNIAGITVYAYAGASLTDCHNLGNINSRGTGVAGICVDAAAGVDFLLCSNEGDLTTTTTTANTYMGGIVAQSNPNIFAGCYNTGALTGSNKSNGIAGIIANLRATSGRSFTLLECYNTGDITGSAHLGGLTGNSATTVGGTAIEASDCFNSGNISSIATANVASSGTAGLFANYNAGSKIMDCYNTGTVSSVACQNVGGITGFYKANPGTSATVIISGCRNEGAIISSTHTAGGISGAVAGYTTITDCYNLAPVTALNSVGGILGGATIVSTSVTNCWNAGTITATGTATGAYTAVNSGIAAGGIAGRAQGSYSYCYNLGQVSGATYVGGIAGQPTKGSSLTACGTQVLNCYNAGALSSTVATGEVGHLIGMAANWNESYNLSDGSFYVSDVDGNEAGASAIGNALTTKELVSENGASIGSNWVRNLYCMPVVKSQAGDDYALLNSICLFDNTDGTLKPVNGASTVANTLVIGNPGSIDWSSSHNVTVDGNEVNIHETINGEVTLTATRGDYSRSFTFMADFLSGISDIESDNADGDAVYYDLNGVRVLEPVKGRIYIRVINGKATKLIL